MSPRAASIEARTWSSCSSDATQPLAQHFLHRLAHRVVVVAGDGLDFRTRGAQAVLQRIGGVEQLPEGAIAPAAAAAKPGGEAGGEGLDQHRQGKNGHNGTPADWPAV